MYLILIIMNIIWGSSYTAQKWGLEYMAPMHMLLARLTIAFIVMFIVSSRGWPKMDRRGIARCAGLGAIIAAAHGLGFIGIDESHAVDASILYALEPIAAIVFARIILKERMDIWRKTALILALAGFSVLSNMWSSNVFKNITFWGNLILLAGVFCDGLFSPVAKPVAEKYPARVILTLALFFAAIFILPFAIATPIRPTTFTWKPWVSIFYLAVLCSAFGWTLWVYFLRRFPVNVIAPTVFIQPIVGPFISYFTIGEEISARVWFGGGIILVAIAIAVFKRKISETEIIAEAVVH
jgi:drug/metabolite transporter (DMT)-like permease